MGKVIKSIIGGGSQPRSSQSSAQSTQSEARKANRSRAALFETEGGVVGEEVEENGVAQRGKLLGN